MGLSVGGIVSGLDTTSMVASLVAAASTPKTLLEDDLATLEDKQEAFAGLSNRLDDFATALEAIDTVDELRALSGTSTDDTAVAVSLAGDAVMGSYQVVVNSLASNEMQVSQGYASKDTDGAFSSGVLTITYGDNTAVDITLSADDTSLKNVMDAINEQVDGVTAYIMDTGDATEPYRLVIVGDDTGAANGISISMAPDGTTGTAPVFTETISAADASVTVNGITITDDDNSIDTAIQGVTFTVKETTTSAVTINVDRDDEAIVTKVQAFVDAYNAVIDYIDQQKAFNPDEDIKGPFVGESLARTVESTLQSVLTNYYTVGSSIAMLADLGLTSSQSGNMEFDTDTFKSMLESDFSGVIDFFTNDVAEDETVSPTTPASFLNALRGAFELLNDADDGLLAAKDDALSESISNTQERIDDFDDYLAEYEARLNEQFLNMELTLARLQANQSALEALMPSTDSSSDDNK